MTTGLKRSILRLIGLLYHSMFLQGDATQQSQPGSSLPLAHVIIISLPPLLHTQCTAAVTGATDWREGTPDTFLLLIPLVTPVLSLCRPSFCFA